MKYLFVDQIFEGFRKPQKIHINVSNRNKERTKNHGIKSSNKSAESILRTVLASSIFSKKIDKRTTPFYIAKVLAIVFYIGSVEAEDVLIDQNEKRSKAYIILQAEMTDPDVFFNEYAVPAEVEVSAYGGRPLVATFDKNVFEGSWENNWTIILTFPSMQAATDWYYSANYQAVLPMRHAATAYGNMVFFNGSPESVINWSIAEFRNVEVSIKEPLTLDPTPEYIITMDPKWGNGRGRFLAEAAFNPKDVSGARLTVELNVPPAYVDEGKLRIKLYLKDTAGRLLNLDRIKAKNLLNDEWLSFSYDIPEEVARYSGRLQLVDIRGINAVGIEVLIDGRHNPVGGDIRIKNLKIIK